MFEKVKANASIDWTIKESVKAKLKVIVKKISTRLVNGLELSRRAFFIDI